MDDSNVKKPYIDPRWYMPPAVKIPICRWCKHRGKNHHITKSITCAAYPSGIGHWKVEGEEHTPCGGGYYFIDGREDDTRNTSR